MAHNHAVMLFLSFSTTFQKNSYFRFFTLLLSPFIIQFNVSKVGLRQNMLPCLLLICKRTKNCKAFMSSSLSASHYECLFEFFFFQKKPHQILMMMIMITITQTDRNTTVHNFCKDAYHPINTDQRMESFYYSPS